MNGKRALTIIGIVIGLLLIPFVATLMSDEVNWSVSDFVIMGTLLTITGFVIDFIIRKFQGKTFGIVLIAIVIVLFLLIWAEMAVGLFGSPIAGS